MPWSGGSFTRTNGVHTGSTLWVQDRDAGTKILATRHDTHDQDLADGINATLEKSGSNAATGNLDIGSNRITLVADGTAKTDAATVNQIQSNAPAFQATDTGTANAYVIALSPAITAYAAGQAITFKAANASTTASTLNVNTLGTKALKKKNDQDIASGDIEASQIITAVYDGTSFQVTSQLGSEVSAGGSNTQVQYNSSGSLAGDGDLTFDGTNLTVANPLYLPDGAVATPAIANTGDLNSGIYFPAADTVGVTVGGEEKWRFGSNELAGENLIINGDLLVVQRGVSFTGVDPADGDYSLDRWLSIGGGGTPADRYTVSQVAATAGALLAGFAKAIRAETTTAETSPHANRYSAPISQRVELKTALQLGYGASGAKPLTVSFWVRSSQTGTHGIAIAMSNGAHSNPQSYSVSSADTWEKKTVTFAGNTSAAIALNYGLQLFFLTQLGTTADDGTQNTWGNYLGYTAIADIAGATSRYLEITGVQLTVGASGTDFKFEDYGTTLARCQRYFWRPISGTSTAGPNLMQNAAGGGYGYYQFPVEMRTTPTLAYSDLAHFQIDLVGSAVAPTALAITYGQSQNAWISATWSSAGSDGDALRFYSVNSAATLDWVAEL
jgi:hypothetical protein